MQVHKILYVKTSEIAPTCFDPKIIFRELYCSLLKSHFLKFYFSKEQYSSLKMILGSKHVGAIFKCFNVKNVMYMH